MQKYRKLTTLLSVAAADKQAQPDDLQQSPTSPPNPPEAPVSPPPPTSLALPDPLASQAPVSPIPPASLAPQELLSSQSPSEPPGSSQPPVPPAPDRSVYDPKEHRHVEHPNSVLGSVINLLKACLGTGILAMPLAFKNAGLVLGTFGVLFAGLAVTHAIYILVRTAQEACVVAEKPSMSFSQTCGAAFAYGPKKFRPYSRSMRRFADCSLTLCYMGVLCIYVTFIATSIKEVFDDIISGTKLSKQMYCAIILIPLALICQIRSLKYVVPFSAMANIGIFVVFAITLHFIFTDLPSPSERTFVAPFATWPLFIGIVVFAIEGIGVVMPVENEMARPELFLGCLGVLNVTMGVVVSLYGFVGFMGYVKYGEDVRGSITLNLPHQGFISQFTKLLMAVVIFFTYSLQFYVPMESINRKLHQKDNDRYHNIVQITIRILLVTFTVLVAALVPNLELIITLVGAIFFSTCGILLPVVAETVFRWERNLGPYNYIAWKNVVLFSIGVISLLSGSITALAAMDTAEKDNIDVEYYDDGE